MATSTLSRTLPSPLAMSAPKEADAEGAYARPALPLELQAHILGLALEDEENITGNFKGYLFSM